MAKRFGKGDSNLPKSKINKQNLSKAFRIFSYMEKFKWQFFLGMLFLFLTSAVALVFPWLLGRMVDSAKAVLFEEIDKIALMLLAIFVAQAFFSFFRIYLFSYVTEYTILKLRQDVYQHLIQLPMSFFNTRRVGELNSRISADITQIQETFTTTIAEFLRQAILIVGGITIISFMSGKLTLFMLSMLPIIIVIAIFLGRYVRKISNEVQDRIADSNTIVEETLQGIATVKAFANEFFEVFRYNKSTEAIIEKTLLSARVRGFFASFIILCLFGSIVAVIWFAVRMVQSGELEEGQMFSFFLYTAFVAASIGGISEMYAQIQKSIGSIERVFEILDEDNEHISLSEEIQLPNRLNGQIDFNNITFQYPVREDLTVLKEINLDIKPGERIALVGSSGAGKSTIANLILRFYEPSNGQLLFDGKDAGEYDITALRQQMAVVPQDVLLFGGSIKENIAYGKPNATFEEIESAASKAHATEFIDSFPDKYETIVGERGITLSGGQRQRIAIARAILKDPAILILDEATSSLDSQSEKLVQKALDELMQNRTSIVIAHRLSTIRNVDKIVVLENGKILETGTHEELINNPNGKYYHLSKLQFDLA
ncbi:MAG: ATP-binding cassette domain-containing protein [Bacteroidia bacterium]|nr:ATP-binding cassette domain-containing protein [Bacteroidia bacterium]